MKQEEYKKAQAKYQDNIDVEDIKQIAVRSKVEGKTMEIIKIEFKRIQKEDNKTKRQWRHKRTGQIFSQ